MGKKHKKNNELERNFVVQSLWWSLILFMSFMVWYRTLDMYSNEVLYKVRVNPSITNDMNIIKYYAFWSKYL